MPTPRLHVYHKGIVADWEDGSIKRPNNSI
jgi:hypothetical protein